MTSSRMFFASAAGWLVSTTSRMIVDISTGWTFSRTLPDTIRETLSTSSIICANDAALLTIVSMARSCFSESSSRACIKLCVSRNRIERRPELVRQGGEKLVLEAIRGPRDLQEPATLLICARALRDVAGDLRCPDDDARSSKHR